MFLEETQGDFNKKNFMLSISKVGELKCLYYVLNLGLVVK